ncbi:DUF4167 domain-containing protein [Paracoccus niistensis]|uniref:DUF4167 domain-containing protein n=1 Tax=Paracoccus niistensis TaxID=632935 RepID=UPI00406BBDF4
MNIGTMRSSKSRSRNKSRNNPRSLGNVVNRVFDSSGPEGKVRGTPQQIIEKYLALARDAQLSGDRVAEQSFLQHAEHYTRMLGEAQREQAERQAQFGGQQPGFDGREERNGHPYNGHQQGERLDDRGENRGEARGDSRNEPRGEGRNDGRRDDRNEGRQNDNRQNRRDDRQNRREDREGRPERREGREDNPAEDRVVAPEPVTPEATSAEAPAIAPAPNEPPTNAGQERDTAAGEQPGFPEFLQAPLSALPEARGDEDAAPVETPENRTEAPETAESAAPRTRKPRAAGAAPRRAPQRRRKAADEGEAAPQAPEAAVDD